MRPLPAFPSIRLTTVEAIVLRVPIDEPVQTSFGVMYDRPAVLVRLEDDQGAVGWGEIWCNFPSVGAEHRARLLESCVAPILLQQAWSHPTQAFEELSRRLRILAIQCGEPGPLAQAISGADIALWDLVGKRLGQPLWQLFGGASRVRTYASGLSPTAPELMAAAKHDEGYRAFKLKVGFGAERDLHNLRTLRDLFGSGTSLMVDANQAWTPDQAREMSQRFAEFNPVWLEEPIAADYPIEVWQQLAKSTPLPLAAGENLRGAREFSDAIRSGALSVIQPDLGKWGGFSGCLEVGQHAIDSGIMFCPHWLGGGVGLLASMHLRGAFGDRDYVEVDSNPNPLRELLLPPGLKVVEGMVTLPDSPGLGLSLDMNAVGEFRRPHAY
ncbi:mandelate racemase/muconate lactonizing enzyme family protein [Herbaspirillum sp. GCM10030257]|uniref:mandelate racemase/muconate lactonizing enzyme family protein n=1 Tax=Herbaspirillum sp. GCM10030257 TaxID=3273393 RepID=UPI0036168D71